MKSELERLCESRGVKASAQYGAVELPEGWNDNPGAHPYKVTLRYKRRTLTTPFFMGAAHTREPGAADVLYCLCADARSGEMSFEEFCSEFGYDPDSRKHHATWKACAKMAPRLRRFLGDDFETFATTEH